MKSLYLGNDSVHKWLVCWVAEFRCLWPENSAALCLYLLKSVAVFLQWLLLLRRRRRMWHCIGNTLLYICPLFSLRPYQRWRNGCCDCHRETIASVTGSDSIVVVTGNTLFACTPESVCVHCISTFNDVKCNGWLCVLFCMVLLLLVHNSV